MYKFSQYLEESLDKPVPYRVAIMNVVEAVAMFNIGKDDYEINIAQMRNPKHGKLYRIAFFTDAEDPIAMTNRGDQYKVLSTVKAFIIEYFSKYKISPSDQIDFAAKADERSRVALYKRFAKTIAKYVDGDVSSKKYKEDGEDLVMFTITRREPK